MESTKYIGMDVHKDAIAVAVMNVAGKVVMESVLETKAATILQFIRGLRGSLLVTLEEGTWAVKLGKRIQGLRKKKGWTQTDMAAYLEMNRGTSPTSRGQAGSRRHHVADHRQRLGHHDGKIVQKPVARGLNSCWAARE